MKSLGLDISQTSTGWAVLQDGLPLDFGYLQFDKKLKLSDNLLLFSSYLETILSKHSDLNFVCIEDTFFGRNIRTLKLLTRYSGVAIVTIRKLLPSIRLLILAVASIRSAIFPGQKLDKDKLYRYICSKYKLNNVPDDVTDAIAAALFPFSNKRIEKRWEI